MAQFGIHALIGLWITWSLPSFTPYLIRFSFGAGIYIGCVFPDIDIYASAIAFFIKSSSSSLHRTLTHSIITSTFILFLFLFVEAIVKKRNKSNRREAKLIYDVEADDDSLHLSGTLSSDEKYLGINFKAFGLGLYAGMMIHIMIDIVFWFSPIDILFPLPLFGIGHSIDAWQLKDFPFLVSVVLTLSEPLFLSFFFSALRICVSAKLGKWANVPDAIAQQKRAFTDNDIEQSMDLSLLTDSDICPIDQATLSRARLSLSLSKFLIIFQLLFFTSMCISSFFPFSKKYLEQLVFGELMVIGIPAYCYLSWIVKDVILRRSN